MGDRAKKLKTSLPPPLAGEEVAKFPLLKSSRRHPNTGTAGRSHAGRESQFLSAPPVPNFATSFYFIKFSPDNFHQSSNLPFVAVILSSSILPFSPPKPSAHARFVTPQGGRGEAPCTAKPNVLLCLTLTMVHNLSLSLNLALCVFVLNTPVLASNSKEIPRGLSNTFSFHVLSS